MAGRLEVENGVAPKPEMQMIRNIDLTRLAAVVGGDIIRVGPAGDERISAIRCARLGLSLVVANIDNYSILSHISFEGSRPTHNMYDGRAAIIWADDEVTFVHRPEIIHRV